MTRDVDKALVALRFGRRAASYEAVTPVQNRMACHLAEAVQAARPPEKVRRILDLGCGTGRLVRLLSTSYPAAEITGIDISPQMVEVARQNCPEACFVTADAEEHVRIMPDKYDLIVSNAAMQWFQQPTATLASCRSSLAANGLLALSTFGSETFQELKAAFAHAYEKAGKPCQRHVGEFPDAQFWRRQLPDGEIAEQHFCLDFPDVRSFIRSVQQAGAANSFAKTGHIPRNVLKEMLAWYERSSPAADRAGIRCTYHVIYLFLRAL